jgi:hypothetical protein
MKKRVIAVVTRNVKQVMEVVIGNDGFIEEIINVIDEIESNDEEVQSIRSVISQW